MDLTSDTETDVSDQLLVPVLHKGEEPNKDCYCCDCINHMETERLKALIPSNTDNVTISTACQECALFTCTKHIMNIIPATPDRPSDPLATQLDSLTEPPVLKRQKGTYYTHRDHKLRNMIHWHEDAVSSYIEQYESIMSEDDLWVIETLFPLHYAEMDLEAQDLEASSQSED